MITTGLNQLLADLLQAVDDDFGDQSLAHLVTVPDAVSEGEVLRNLGATTLAFNDNTFRHGHPPSTLSGRSVGRDRHAWRPAPELGR